MICPLFLNLSELSLWGIYNWAAIGYSPQELPVWFLEGSFFFFQPAIISQIVWQFPKQKVFNFFFRLRCFILTISIRLLVLAFSGAGTPNRLNKILTTCLVHDANELYQLQNFQHHKNRQHC